MTEWLTQQEAEEYLSVSRTTLWRWQKQGKLTVYKFGRQRRYKREDLDALAEPVEPDDEERSG
jgi:excisionase family DNA binding protein